MCGLCGGLVPTTRLSYASDASSEYDPYPCLERDRERGLRPETLEFAAYHERPATSPREDRAAGNGARARARRVVTASRGSGRNQPLG